AFAKAWRELIDRLDAIHVQARWIVEVMKINRVPERKIAFFRSGLPIIPQGKFSPSERQPGSPLKITMLGRCEAIKGQEVLIDAVQSLPANTKVEVTFLGPYWNSTDYGQRCLSKIAGDSRFHKPRRVAPQAIAGELAQADALVVPSIWLETGPLVVLEAFAVGLPVIGSNRGGIAELITHEKNGWLFPTGDSQALAHLLQKAFDDPSSLEKLRRQITPPRLMADTAADTKKLYESLVSCQ
ncbi:MAG TPA: glycosyltransferase, partial [Gemmatales bacterium]|nr:glycosyltransferase [Gemmatales bacterium]